MKWNNICIFFFKFFPHLIIAENWVEFPVLYSRSMLVIYFKYQFSSVTQSCLTPYNPMDCSSPGFPVHHQFPELAQAHVHQVSDAIQSSHLLSVIPFSSCLQSFPASGSFPIIWLFASGGQSVGASSLASALPMTVQGWFPLGLTGLISLQRVF